MKEVSIILSIIINNLGVKYATGEFLLFLNKDTEIVCDLIDVLVT